MHVPWRFGALGAFAWSLRALAYSAAACMAVIATPAWQAAPAIMHIFSEQRALRCHLRCQARGKAPAPASSASWCAVALCCLVARRSPAPGVTTTCSRRPACGLGRLKAGLRISSLSIAKHQFVTASTCSSMGAPHETYGITRRCHAERQTMPAVIMAWAGTRLRRQCTCLSWGQHSRYPGCSSKHLSLAVLLLCLDDRVTCSGSAGTLASLPAVISIGGAFRLH